LAVDNGILLLAELRFTTRWVIFVLQAQRMLLMLFMLFVVFHNADHRGTLVS